MPLVVALLATRPHVDPSSIAPPLVLLGIALIGASYLILTRRSKQPIALPLDHTPVTGLSDKDKPLDIDYEIDPDGFYPRLRLKKLVLLGILLLLTSLHLFKLAWDGLRGEKWEVTTEDAIMVAFWVSFLQLESQL